MIINEADVLKSIELKKQYEAMFPDMTERELYPIGFYQIRDYTVKNNLLNQALIEEKMLRDLDFFIELESRLVEQRLVDTFERNKNTIGM